MEKVEKSEKAVQKPEQDRSHIIHDRLLADSQNSAQQESQIPVVQSKYLPEFEITNSEAAAAEKQAKR